MNFFRHIILFFCLFSSLNIGLLDAMKHTLEDPNESDQPEEKKICKESKEKEEEINNEVIDQNESLSPIVIIINHLEKDNGGMLGDLKKTLDAEFCLDSNLKPIVMVSPCIISDLLEELEKNYKDRPGSTYEGKTQSIVRNCNPDNSMDCMNFFEEALKELVFINNPESHFVFMFPQAYLPYLSKYNVLGISTPDELKNLIHGKQNISPCKNDFNMLATICKTINTNFKVFVTGHGYTSPQEKYCFICNFLPSDCSDMLQSLNRSNILTVALNSCCLGGHNRYFLQREKTEESWVPTKYSFNLIIRGTSDLPTGIGPSGYISNFLESTITTDMQSKDILHVLTEYDLIKPYALQILPANDDSFVSYENGFVAIIDEQTNLNEQYVVSSKQAILIYTNQVKTALIIEELSDMLRILLLNPECQHGTFENITINSKNKWTNTGVVNFIKKAFSDTSCSTFPKTILIKSLEGKNDIPFELEQKKGFNGNYDSLPTIKLHTVEITANDGLERLFRKVDFSFSYDNKDYTN